MRCSHCGNEFSEARARLGFDCCLECGGKEAAVETARRALMIAPISHKSGYTYLGPDGATQRQRLLEGSAKTPRMETGHRSIGRAVALPQRVRPRRYEFAGWEFKPDKRGIRQKRAILRELPAVTPDNCDPQE
jgi:predicted  nucleic acid-binding Zn-ribbon protein